MVDLGVKCLRVSVDSGANKVIESLISKIERCYSLCVKEHDYVEKLYAAFKILCIGCLNFPEIIPLVLEKRITVGSKSFEFVEFLLDTLKICLPLFCEFVALIIKTNYGFKEINQNEQTPMNILTEMSIRQKLVDLMKK